MDALALLCNLYGDGPATLNRLKSAGLSSVAALEEIDPQGLAETLETTEAAARRFLREARLLDDRVIEASFDEEPRPPIAVPGGGEVRIDYEEDLEDDFDDQEEEEEGVDEFAFAADDEVEYEEELDPDPLVDEVLTTWRERDVLIRAEASEPEEPEEPEEVAVEAPAAVADAVVGTPLETRLLDGLSGVWCRRLAEAGIETVEALAEVDSLPAAARMGVGLTELERFRFFARRHLAETTQSVAGVAVAGTEPRGTLVPRAPLPPAEAAVTEPAEASRLKFSLSEAPFGVATSPLARDLDRAVPAPELHEGIAGPFG